MKVFDIYIIFLICQSSISKHLASKWETNLPFYIIQIFYSGLFSGWEVMVKFYKCTFAALPFRWWVPCIQPVNSSSLILPESCGTRNKTTKFLPLKIKKPKDGNRFKMPSDWGSPHFTTSSSPYPPCMDVKSRYWAEEGESGKQAREWDSGVGLREQVPYLQP